MEVQEVYQQSIIFATLKHLELNQCVPSTNMPYVVHLSNVAMEILMAFPYTTNFDLKFALQLALLHDTLEDTSTSFEELKTKFNIQVAEGVLALTKNKKIAKNERMLDSLLRIKEMKKEVWAVKLADRITNLQSPPSHWDKTKIISYQQEATIILEHLTGGNAYLEKRLSERIVNYQQYIN